MSGPGCDYVEIRVPGSTSNCGAGFDTLGLALRLYNRVTLARAAAAEPEPATEADARAREMVRETAQRFFAVNSVKPFGFRYGITGEVPAARGLGSSVTVRAGVMAGLATLAGAPLTRRELAAEVTALEGHPDNAAASVLGGFCVSRCDPVSGAYVDTIKIPIREEAVFVVASPATEMLTKEARGVLPAHLPYFDAVRSINSAAFLVAALASGDYERLPRELGDFMHEPYRLPLIPGAQAAIRAGTAAGAWTGWLSGSGSSVLCMAANAQAREVGAAMEAAFAQAGVGAETRILAADNDGLCAGELAAQAG